MTATKYLWIAIMMGMLIAEKYALNASWPVCIFCQLYILMLVVGKLVDKQNLKKELNQ